MSDEMKRELNGVKLRLDKVESRLDGVEAYTRRVAIAVVNLEKKMDDGFERMSDEIKQIPRDIVLALDRLSGEVEASRKERLLGDRSFNDFRSRIDDHEVRIHRLESGGPRP